MIKAVLIDDEPDAIEVLTTLLARSFPDIEIIGVFTNAREALAKTPDLSPQLVFLDIEMPGMNGLEVMDRLNLPESYFVFFTAHEKYALKALKQEALDYLLKPIDPQELLDTVNKVRARIELNDRPDYVTIARQLLQADRIRIPTGKGWRLLEVSDIVFIRAQGNYSDITMSDGSTIVVIKLLREFEEELASSGFFRPHNSYLVNPRHVLEYVRSDGGWLILSNQAEISVSKKYRQDLNKLTFMD